MGKKKDEIDYEALLETQTTTSSSGSMLTEKNISKAWDKSMAKWLIDLLFKGKKIGLDGKRRR